MRFAYPTPAQIWAWMRREIPQISASWYTLSQHRFTPLVDLADGYPYNALIKPIVASDQDIAVHWNSSTGNETTETTRMTKHFFSPIFGKGKLKGYYIMALSAHIYVSTAAGNYYYKIYARPCYYDSSGNINYLEDERQLGSVTTVQESTAGWYESSINATLQVSNVNLSFDGVLGLRLRTTSWTDVAGGATTGHGLRNLESHNNFKIGFRYVLD